MKKVLLLAAFLISIFYAQAQDTMLGLDRDEVISAQSWRGEQYIMEESITDHGMPFIFYFHIVVSKGEGYFFQKGVCVKYSIITTEDFRKVFLKELTDDGYFFDSGFWINTDKQTMAIYSEENDRLRLTYMSLGYYIENNK